MKQKTKKNMPILLSIIIGIVSAYLLTVIGAMIGAAVVSSGNTTNVSFKLITSFVWIVSTFTGCIIATKLAGKQTLLVCALSVIGYIALLAATQIMFFNSEFSEVLMPVVIAAAGAIPVILWNAAGIRGKRTKKRYRFS